MIQAGDLVAHIGARAAYQPTDTQFEYQLAAQRDARQPSNQTVDSGGSVRDAMIIMAEQNTSALMVLEDQQVVGIISEQDYAQKVALKDRRSDTTRVDEVMSRNLCMIDSHRTIDECLNMAKDAHVQHLCVVDGEQTLGLISMTDIMRALQSDRERHVRDLKLFLLSSSQMM